MVILSATIAVTFITPSGKVEYMFPLTLRVRRARVREALDWLQKNNPLYSNIIISDDRLKLLPEDDVPQEIKVNARYSNDIEAVIREHEGYVPSDRVEDLEGEGKVFFCQECLGS
jgi:hypothetical protein